MMNKDNRNDKIRKIAKKGLTFSLCAVLAGGLAAGSFEGVNKLAFGTVDQVVCFVKIFIRLKFSVWCYSIFFFCKSCHSVSYSSLS